MIFNDVCMVFIDFFLVFNDFDMVSDLFEGFIGDFSMAFRVSCKVS